MLITNDLDCVLQSIAFCAGYSNNMAPSRRKGTITIIGLLTASIFQGMYDNNMPAPDYRRTISVIFQAALTGLFGVALAAMHKKKNAEAAL